LRSLWVGVGIGSDKAAVMLPESSAVATGPSAMDAVAEYLRLRSAESQSGDFSGNGPEIVVSGGPGWPGGHPARPGGASGGGGGGGVRERRGRSGHTHS